MATHKRSSDKDLPPKQDTQSQEEDSGNKFVNDGSFMELFRKRMEEEKKKKEENDVKTRTSGNSTAGGGQLSSDSQKKPPSEPQKNSTKPYQGIIGKRKALMKSIELREKRKRRREELEEQQSQEEKEAKTSAWKAYMAEVKAYEAQNCTDGDNFKRPLVK